MGDPYYPYYEENYEEYFEEDDDGGGIGYLEQTRLIYTEDIDEEKNVNVIDDDYQKVIMKYVTTEENAGNGLQMPDHRFGCMQDEDTDEAIKFYLHVDVLKCMLNFGVAFFVINNSDEDNLRDSGSCNVAIRVPDSVIKKEEKKAKKKKEEDEEEEDEAIEDEEGLIKKKKAEPPAVPQYQLFINGLKSKGQGSSLTKDRYSISGVDFGYSKKPREEIDADNIFADRLVAKEEGDFEPFNYVKDEDFERGPGLMATEGYWPNGEGYYRIQLAEFVTSQHAFSKMIFISLIELFIVYVFMTWCASTPDTCLQDSTNTWQVTCSGFAWAYESSPMQWRSPAMKAYFYYYRNTFVIFCAARFGLVLIPKFFHVGKRMMVLFSALWPWFATLQFVIYLIITHQAMQACALCNSCSVLPHQSTANDLSQTHSYPLWMGTARDKTLTKEALLGRLAQRGCVPADANGLCNHIDDPIKLANFDCPVRRYEVSLKQQYEIAEDAQNAHEPPTGVAAAAPTALPPMAWQTLDCKYWSKKLPPKEMVLPPNFVAASDNSDTSMRDKGYVFWNGKHFEDSTASPADVNEVPTAQTGWHLRNDVGYCNEECNAKHASTAQAAAIDPTIVQDQRIETLWSTLGCPCADPSAQETQKELQALADGVDPVIAEVQQPKTTGTNVMCGPPRPGIENLMRNATAGEVKLMREHIPTWIPRMPWWPTLGTVDYKFACFAKADLSSGWKTDSNGYKPRIHGDIMQGNTYPPGSNPDDPDDVLLNPEWEGKCVYYNATHRAACICTGNGDQMCYAKVPSQPLGAQVCGLFNYKSYKYGSHLQYGGRQNFIFFNKMPFVSTITAWEKISTWIYLTISIGQLASNPFGVMDKEESKMLTKTTVDLLDSFLFFMYLKKFGVQNARQKASFGFIPQFRYAEGWYDAIWNVWLLATLSTIASVSFFAFARVFDVDKVAEIDPAKTKMKEAQATLQDDIEVLRESSIEQDDLKVIMAAQAKEYEKAIGDVFKAHSTVWILPQAGSPNLTLFDPSSWVSFLSWRKVKIIYCTPIKDVWDETKKPESLGYVNLYVTSVWPWPFSTKVEEKWWEEQDEFTFQEAAAGSVEAGTYDSETGIWWIQLKFDDLFQRVRSASSYTLLDCRYLGWCFYPWKFFRPNGFQPRSEVDVMKTMDTRLPIIKIDGSEPERDDYGVWQGPVYVNSEYYGWTEKNMAYIDTLRSFFLVDLPFFLVRFYWDWYHPAKPGGGGKLPLLMLKNFFMCLYDFFYLISCGNSKFECCGMRPTSNVADLLKNTKIGKAVKVGIMPEANISQQAAGLLLRKPLEAKFEDLQNERLLMAYKRYIILDSGTHHEDQLTDELNHEIRILDHQCEETEALIAGASATSSGKIAAKVKLG